MLRRGTWTNAVRFRLSRLRVVPRFRGHSWEFTESVNVHDDSISAAGMLAGMGVGHGVGNETHRDELAVVGVGTA